MQQMWFESTLSGVAGRPRTRSPKPHETTLQTIFVRRVREEMESRGIANPTALSRRAGAPPQRTIAAVLEDGVVPGLTVVAGISAALGVHPWQLLVEKIGASQRTTNVRELPDRYPSWSEKLGKQGKLKRKVG